MADPSAPRRPAGRARSSAWPQFEAALAAALAVLDEGVRLVLSDSERSEVVRLEARGRFGVRAEASSNASLDRDDQLTPQDESALAALGWLPPTATEASTASNGAAGPDDAGGVGEPGVETSVDFSRDYAAPVPFGDVALLAAHTFSDVYLVPHPGELRYEAFAGDGTRVLLPTLGLAGAERPTTAATAVGRVLAVLRDATGDPDLDVDDDGDIGIRFGSAVVYVRVIEDPPFVRVFSPLLIEIEPSSALIERLNDLNANAHFAKLVHVDGAVIGAIDVFGLPLEPEHVLRACRVLGELADDFDDALQLDFGGRTAFGDYKPPTRDASTGGYL